LRTISFDPETASVELVDQTLLPAEFRVLKIKTIDDLCEAIASLRVRGAPALGAAGGFGVALATLLSGETDIGKFKPDIARDAEKVASTRPTAVNLRWGVERVLTAMDTAGNVEEARQLALHEAQEIADDDVRRCRAIGENGASLLRDGDTVLTHCNAGRMACVDWGTALGVVRSAVESGKRIKVISCETRPLNQGSRITCWEMGDDGIPVTLISDSMSGMVMRRGMVDCVVVGADRITGDAVFNKIGTYSHAVLAKHHDIPFYVAAPLSTFDFELLEKDIIIEERDADELRKCGEKLLAPADVRVYNPAFDATPMELVTAVITEAGVHRVPLDMDELARLA
jgi:methylthioribose-1-phosphate isomerase